VLAHIIVENNTCSEWKERRRPQVPYPAMAATANTSALEIIFGSLNLQRQERKTWIEKSDGGGLPKPMGLRAP
jgi:hypothetical protein